MMNDNGSINLQFVKEQSNILKIQVQSRHISRKLYRCFSGYRPNSIGFAGIEKYACECANGRRTVGCCSHIAAIIYHTRDIFRKSYDLLKFSVNCLHKTI